MEYLEYGLWGLFGIAFLSATILPFSSEVVLIAFLLAGFSPLDCLLVSTLGNTIGGSTNFFFGRIGNPKWLDRLGFKQSSIRKFELRAKKYGAWLAWFSWVPFVGDPLIIAMGYFRTKVFPTMLFMFLGKMIRYIMIIYVAGYW